MICQAVDYLHSVGIAHRDIKPENILMSKGSRPLCKVGDFGLAKMIDAGTKWVESQTRLEKNENRVFTDFWFCRSTDGKQCAVHQLI